MGVVIQEMVPAHQAGVLFTRNPVTGDCATMVLNANFGVGEVSGTADPSITLSSVQYRCIMSFLFMFAHFTPSNLYCLRLRYISGYQNWVVH